MLLTAVLAGGARAPRRNSADSAKAAYLYLEAISAINDGKIDRAVQLLDRAGRLDPADPDIAAMRGELTYATGYGDSLDFVHGYEAMRDRYLANPADADNGTRFANLAMRLSRYDDVRMAYRKLAEALPARSDFALNYAWSEVLRVMFGDSSGIDTALAIYDRLESGLGPDPLVMSHRIRTLSMIGDTAAVKNEITRLYRSAPADPEIAVLAARSYAGMDMPDSAMAYFDRACAIDSTYSPAYLMRAEYYMELGDSSAYDREVFRALESPDLEFESKFELLTNYVRALYADTTRTDRISRMFKRLELINPGQAELHSLYGSFLAMQDSAAAAAEQFGYAVDLDPEDNTNWNYLINTLYASGDTVGALRAGRRAITHFPDNLLFPLYTASIAFGHDGPAEALAILDSFDVSHFDNPEALSDYHTMRGDYLYAMEQRDSAFAAYDKALKYNPMNSSAANNAAYYMAVDNRDLGRAEELIVTALRDQPLNPTFIDTYAWVLFRQKKYPEARKQIDAALSLYQSPDTVAVDSVAVDFTAVDSVDSEMLEEIEAVEISSAYEEPSADILDHAGDIYFMNGEPEQALKFWTRAAALDPENENLKKKIKNKAYFFE